MLARTRQQAPIQEDENVFWVTMSDLLLGLFITFVVLFVFAITGFTQNKIKQQEIQYEVGKKLASEFKKNHINVEIDKVTGKIKISDLELFELNKYELSPRGKKFLNKFLPIYLNTLFANKDIKKHIAQIIIEGHTDSHTFIGAHSFQENYVKNMDLSLKRAGSVASYIVFINFPKKNSYENNLIQLMSVNGKSFTEPIIVKGKEDYRKSRRVELKIMFKDYGIMDLLQKNKPPSNNK